MSSTATTTVNSKDPSSSSASQKFWPLKKFNLHNHGKTADEQSIPLTQTERKTSASPPIVVIELAKDSSYLNEKDAQQKKSKNKRLSSLLSGSRRQEGNNSIQNLQSHVNTPESIAADNTKKQQLSNASNTPTLTRKPGREIGNRTRAATQNSNITTTNKFGSMTAKSAGSATLAARSNNAIITSSQQPLNNGGGGGKTAKAATVTRNNNTLRTSEDKLSLKRPQSPPTTTQQPNIMLESIQQQIQLEQQKLYINNEDDVDNDSVIEQNNVDDTKKDIIIAKSANVIEFNDTPPPIKNPEVIVVEESSPLAVTIKKEDEDNEYGGLTNNKVLSPLPSPPITPAATATSLPEFTTTIKDESSTNTAGIINIHSEPVSPTICCTFDVLQQSMQQQHNKFNEIEKLNQQSINTLFAQQQQQPIHQRSIHLSRTAAASFATLRQLASTNNTFQYHQQQQYHNQQIQQIKRRPVSFIESGSNYINYATSDDYLTVNNNNRPTYVRRASSEDNQQFHIRQQQSDNNNNSIQYNVGSNSRRLVRSNTVHNLIIKDGQGQHRIVQCVGLDESPPPSLIKRKTSSFESSNESYHHDWSPPPETMDDCMSTRQQQIEEQQQQQQQQLLLIQQQNHLAVAVAAQQDNNTDTSSDSSSSNNNGRIKRNDSAKSISSLSSASPPITSYDSKLEKLKNKLDKERATVKVLQKQKEACNKDVAFLSKNVDDLTADNTEWKKKYENEKTLKERFQDDLSATMDKFNEATEQIRQLENQTKVLKSEIDEKNKDIREFEKKKPLTMKFKSFTTTEGGKSSGDRLLAAQLQHSQNQVRLLKSTMEQFLRMGVFNDDLNSSNSSLASSTTSIETVVSDFKYGRSTTRQQQQRRMSPGNNNNKSLTTTSSSTTAEDASSSSSNNNTPTDADVAAASHATTRSRKSLVPTENNTPNKATKTPEKKINKQHQDELDIELLELLREKEILQAEYSKAPSSGGNALVRRRREELESRLDTVDSQMCRIKLKMRSRNIL